MIAPHAFIHRLTVLGAVIVISATGCSVITLSSVNKRIEPGGSIQRTRATEIIDPEAIARSNGVFIGVAMSGGGSRAANFSAAVLFELQRLGLLPYVAAISSVSGGSLAAAYYSLFGTGPEGSWQQEKVKRRFAKNLEWPWFFRWFLPQNFIRGWFTNFNRNNIMMQVFDRTFFEGRTFAAIPAESPVLLINATSFTTGQRFVFSDETLSQGLGSQLADVPVSFAVMASGSFPGVFHNVTLQNYSFAREDHYEHLYDGGPVDNLGVLTLGALARAIYQRDPTKAKGCFLVVADAYPYQELPQHVLEADTRTLVDRIFNTNAMTASEVLLTTRREDILKLAMIDVRPGVKMFPLGDMAVARSYACKVWLVTFQRLLSSDFGGASTLPAYQARAVAQVVNAIPTRYGLTGSKGYSAESLQDYLFEAARLLMREDRPVLEEVCKWFSGDHALPAFSCPVSLATIGDYQ